jgi:D-methionine transport system ATP-binding protein
MIQLENISVTFGSGERKFSAVDDVSLEIKKGEIFGIVGSSGAGKSTLVRTINLLQRPTKGTVKIDGVDITNYKGETLRNVRLKVGMIFQHFNLIKGKTVFDNIAFALKASGKSKAEIKARTEELLSIVGLSDKSNAYPAQLSGGQKQRVGIARALANHPEILLCDEATSALDLETTESILQLLKEINKEFGITIVLITHEMDVVKSICNRVAVMKEGKVIEFGDSYDIFASPKEDFTKQLIERTLKLEIPKEILEESKGTIVKVTYKGTGAVDPILSNTAKKYSVHLSILHGKIEYIGGSPLGMLVVGLDGEKSDIQNAFNYIKESTYEAVIYNG